MYLPLFRYQFMPATPLRIHEFDTKTPQMCELACESAFLWFGLPGRLLLKRTKRIKKLQDWHSEEEMQKKRDNRL